MALNIEISNFGVKFKQNKNKNIGICVRLSSSLPSHNMHLNNIPLPKFIHLFIIIHNCFVEVIAISKISTHEIYFNIAFWVKFTEQKKKKPTKKV